MTQTLINIGTVANDGTGDPLRTAFNSCNLNFTDLYRLTIQASKTPAINGSVTITGTDSTVITLPGVTATLAGLAVAQTWTAVQTFTNSYIKLLGSSTGATTFTSANAGASNYTLTFPAATDTIGCLGTAQTWSAVNTYSSTILSSKTITGSLNQGGFAYGTLPYSDVDIFGSFNMSVNSYAQMVVSNSNAGATASADFVVSNNLGTATTYYGNLGMNSSAFTGTGSLNAANAVYVTATTGDLAIGTTGASAIHIVANSSAADAITVSSANVPTLNKAQVSTGGSTTTMGVGGNLTTQVSAAGVSPGGTGTENVIATYTVPASAFDVAGREIKITGFGKYAANGNTKQVKIYVGCTTATIGSAVVGGTVITDNGAVTSSGTGWRAVGRVVKYGAGASNTQVGMQDNGLTSVVVPVLLTMTESAAIIIAITGNATTATTDIVLNGLIVEYAN